MQCLVTTTIRVVVEPNPDTDDWDGSWVDDWQRGVRDAYTVHLSIVFQDTAEHEEEVRSYSAQTAPIEDPESESLHYIESLKQHALEDLRADRLLTPGYSLEWPEPTYVLR
jgi:hypothetical protein